MAPYCVRGTRLIIDANCENLGSNIVAADYSMVLWDRLIRMYPELVDSTERRLRALERLCQPRIRIKSNNKSHLHFLEAAHTCQQGLHH